MCIFRSRSKAFNLLTFCEVSCNRLFNTKSFISDGIRDLLEDHKKRPGTIRTLAETIEKLEIDLNDLTTFVTVRDGIDEAIQSAREMMFTELGSCYQNSVCSGPGRRL